MTSTNPGRGPVAAMLMVFALLAASCSRDRVLDPAYQPEGIAADSLARLILWPELPVTASIYSDKVPIGRGPEDLFLQNVSFQRNPLGGFNGMVLDNTRADAYEILRTEEGGGSLPLFDHGIGAARRWLDRQWEAYRFSDGRPSRHQPPTYRGRGLLSGSITGNSPLTNPASFRATPVSPISLFYTSDTTLSWNPVPGARYYIAHIFNLRQAVPSEQILSGQLAPLYLGSSSDFFIGISKTPGVVGFSPIKNILALGAGYNPTVLTARDSLPAATYELRVAAVDSLGQLVGFSFGDSGTVSRADSYIRYPKGSRTLPQQF